MHRFDEFVPSPCVSHDRLASKNKLTDSPKWRACSQALTDGSSYLGGKGEIKTRLPPFGIK